MTEPGNAYPKVETRNKFLETKEFLQSLGSARRVEIKITIMIAKVVKANVDWIKSR